MIDDLVTGLPDGALPAPDIENSVTAEMATKQVCGKTILRITFLCRTNDRIVGRCDLWSSYWIDEHDEANGHWSLALPAFEWMQLLCTLLRSPFMDVVVRNEELLYE